MTEKRHSALGLHPIEFKEGEDNAELLKRREIVRRPRRPLDAHVRLHTAYDHALDPRRLQANQKQEGRHDVVDHHRSYRLDSSVLEDHRHDHANRSNRGTVDRTVSLQGFHEQLLSRILHLFLFVFMVS